MINERAKRRFNSEVVSASTGTLKLMLSHSECTGFSKKRISIKIECSPLMTPTRFNEMIRLLEMNND